MALTLARQCHFRRAAGKHGVVDCAHDHRRHRPPRFLFAAPRHRGAAVDQPRHPGALARCGRAARARARLPDALPRPVSRGFRTLPRLHAGGAGRPEMADRAPRAGDPDRRVLHAAAGRRGGPDPAGPRAGNVRRSGAPAARGVAGAGAVWPADRGDPEPARRVDAHRQYAVRSRPALFARADHAIAAADLVHPGLVGRGAVPAAGRQ